MPPTPCRWRIPDPAALLDRVVVLKKLDPGLWKRVPVYLFEACLLLMMMAGKLNLRCVQAPRRNCCRVVSSPTKGKDRRMTIDVGVCREGEFARV